MFPVAAFPVATSAVAASAVAASAVAALASCRDRFPCRTRSQNYLRWRRCCLFQASVYATHAPARTDRTSTTFAGALANVRPRRAARQPSLAKVPASPTHARRRTCTLRRHASRSPSRCRRPRCSATQLPAPATAGPLACLTRSRYQRTRTTPRRSRDRARSRAPVHSRISPAPRNHADSPEPRARRDARTPCRATRVASPRPSRARCRATPGADPCLSGRARSPKHHPVFIAPPLRALNRAHTGASASTRRRRRIVSQRS